MEDSKIIELFWQRDEQAIAETENKYGGFCHHIAMRLLDVREDAEECVQDTFLAAWRQIPPTLPGSLKAFLGRVTRNLAISRYRSSTAQKRCSGVEAMLSELEECLPDRGDGPEARADSKELSYTISRWLCELGDADRQLFLRRYWYGDTIKELAIAMDAEHRDLSNRTYRLRKKLKAYLEKEGYYI